MVHWVLNLFIVCIFFIFPIFFLSNHINYFLLCNIQITMDLFATSFYLIVVVLSTDGLDPCPSERPSFSSLSNIILAICPTQRSIIIVRQFGLGFQGVSLTPLGYVGTWYTHLSTSFDLGFRRRSFLLLGYEHTCHTSISSIQFRFSEMCPPPPRLWRNLLPICQQ